MSEETSDSLETNTTEYATPLHTESESITASSSFVTPLIGGTFERHPEFWFDDGNVVLVARRTVFRIYGGLLCSQSAVFTSIFSSTASSSTYDIFEGCPVIHLTDSPQDLTHLLRVLLPNSRIKYHSTEPDPVRPFDEISAVIRLAHKYHIPQVRDQALAALQQCHSTSDFIVNPGHAVGAVNLARLVDMPSLLPLALYTCCVLQSAVLDGWTREDGTVEHLDPVDLCRCVDARVVLARETFLLIGRLFDAKTNKEACASGEHCREMLRRALDRLFRTGYLVELGPLYDWAPLMTDLAQSLELCGACEEELLERNRKERRRIWNKLPEIFGLQVEGWGDNSDSDSEDGGEGDYEDTADEDTADDG